MGLVQVVTCTGPKFVQVATRTSQLVQVATRTKSQLVHNIYDTCRRQADSVVLEVPEFVYWCIGPLSNLVLALLVMLQRFGMIYLLKFALPFPFSSASSSEARDSRDDIPLCLVSGLS